MPSESINALLNKLGEFLNIFDLSFFISGFSCCGALALWGYAKGLNLIHQTNFLPGWVIAIIGSYILGLLCFSVGRWLVRLPYFEYKFYDKVEDMIENHALKVEEPFRNYLENYCCSREEKCKRMSGLYTRMWAQLRHDNVSNRSHQLINQYWTMAATYDGLAISLFVWMAVIFGITFGQSKELAIPIAHGIMLCNLLLFFIWICFREGWRFRKYQAEELIATLASSCGKNGVNIEGTKSNEG